MREERIFLAVDRHPLGHQRAAAADDAGYAFFRERYVIAQDRAVHGHVIDALPGLLFDHVQKIPRFHVGDVVELLGHLVNRHCAHGHGRSLDDPRSHAVDAFAGREIHHRIGPVLQGREKLRQFALRIARQGRLADIGVDLRARGNADADRPEALGKMHFIGRDNHPAAGDLRANQLRRELLVAGNGLHLGRNNAGQSLLNLGHIYKLSVISFQLSVY